MKSLEIEKHFWSFRPYFLQGGGEGRVAGLSLLDPGVHVVKS